MLLFSLYNKSGYKLARPAQKKKFRTISLLMVASQVLLLLFTTEWIRAQYHEQERRLNNDLQNIFIHAEEKLSDSLLDHTVSIILRTPREALQGMEFHVSANATESDKNIKDTFIRRFQLPQMESVTDSLIRIHPQSSKQHTEHIVVESVSGKDALLPENMKKVLRVALLQTANSKGASANALAVPIDHKLLRNAFSRDLAGKKYPFTIHDDSTAQTLPGTLFSYRSNAPNALPITVSGYAGYLAKAILPQVTFSVLLLLLTGLAFWLAYRNMKQQAAFSIQKDQLISNISHELKTPVATTKVALEALSSFNAIDDPVRTKKYLHVATWEMKRLESMIDRVMNLMQTETGNIALQPEHVHFVGLIQDITTILEPVLSGKQITLRETDMDKSIFITADKTHITGALYNILDNAVKYGGDTIIIDLQASGKEAILKISDNGPGIPAGYYQKIFDPFFRVPSGNRHDVKGHGLGLSYARQIIEAHGGSIVPERSAGAGTTFVITLPQSHL